MKSDDMKFEITIEQMAFFTNAVIERDRLRREMREAEIALRGKKETLRRYQAICEKMKNDKKNDLETTVQMLVDVIADGVNHCYPTYDEWCNVAVGILKEINAENFAHDDRVSEAYLRCDAKTSTLGWRPTTRTDMKHIFHICRERGMDEEKAKRFVQWNSTMKWNDVNDETTVDDLITKWIDAMNDD